MSRLRIFLAALLVAVYLFFAYTHRLPPFFGKPNTREVSVAEVQARMLAVKVAGTAHYPLRVSQPREASLTQPARTWWLFPLLPPGEVQGREVRVLVASSREPEAILAFEDMTVEGWAMNADETLNPDLRAAFEDKGYRFAPEVVLIERFPD